MRIHFRGEQQQQLPWSSGDGKGQAGRRNLEWVRQQHQPSAPGGGRLGGAQASASSLGSIRLTTSSDQAPQVVSSLTHLHDRPGEPGCSPPSCPSFKQTVRSQLCKRTGWLTCYSRGQVATRWGATTPTQEASTQWKCALPCTVKLWVSTKAFHGDQRVDTTHTAPRTARASSAKRQGWVTQFTGEYVCSAVTIDVTAVWYKHSRASSKLASLGTGSSLAVELRPA